MALEARARVQVTLEIEAVSCWGEECQISLLRKQATEDVLSQIRAAMRERRFTIVGEPYVELVLAGERLP